MNKRAIMFFSVLCLSLCLSGTAFAEEDVSGAKDHPLFNRLPGTYIYQYQDTEFDAHPFLDEKKPEVSVEGHVYFFRYGYNEGAKRMSSLQILRNYENAVKKIGGTVLVSNQDESSYLKIVKNGKETWVHVTSNIGEPILYIVEKQAMNQDIVANAAAFSNDIRSTGHAAVYGIYFDTGKAELKPESKAALEEIAKLLNNDAGLKVNVVGHTDNVGGADANMKLSQARAESVVKTLVAEYHVDAKRLKPYGVGSLAPVAASKTEEGRAKNRRVELVEQ